MTIGVRVVVCVLLASASLWAQGTTAQINGNVKDSTGLAVPGAEIKGFGVFQFDIALSRIIAIKEKKTLQLRADFFNLPNHLNPATPGVENPVVAATNAGNFGQITQDISGTSGLSSGDPRIIQLALKFQF